MVLGMDVLDRAFKDFHTLDKIFDFEPILNNDARILEWANPMRALPAAFLNILNVLNGLKQQLALPTKEISGSNEPLSRGEKSRNVYKRLS
jgi:hypothetical protein